MNMNYPMNANANSTARPSGAVRGLESLLSFFDLLLAFCLQPIVRRTARGISAVFCFFVFLFVVGAVEAEVISLSAGILFSLFLASIALLCACGKREA